MKKIAFISTGGTIAMKADAAGLAVPSVGAKELVRCIAAMKDAVSIDEFEFINKPSAHLSLEDLVKLRALVLEIIKKKYDGIVITHGTDTMEETAYFLDLTIDTAIPIVLTGAQRNFSAPNTDAISNIVDALNVAADDNAASMGTVIVFSSEILAAREAVKFHKTRLDAFKSIEFGPLGSIDNETVLWHRKPQTRDFYPLGPKGLGTVDIVTSYLGADSRILSSCVRTNVDGIVLQGLGAGHIPEPMLQGIEEAIHASIPVVLTSRPPLGRLLTDTYGFRGGEKHLRDIGVCFGEDLPAQKARIKLLVLLSNGYDNKKIRHEFEKNYYGRKS